MTGVIESLLTSPKTIDTDDENNIGPQRHIYEELKRLQDNDPVLASPYILAASEVTLPVHTSTISSGNFTLTVNFPKYGVTATTANIVFNADAATIQAVLDTAMSGKTVIASYNDGDITVDLSGNLTVNSGSLVADQSSVRGAYMTATTANVDLDADRLGAPVVATPGTQNRAAEGILALFDIVTPSSSIVPQGITPQISDYSVGGNASSMSPATKDALLEEIKANGDQEISDVLRTLIGCVG